MESTPKSPSEQKLKEKRLSMAEDVEVIELGDGEGNSKEPGIEDKIGLRNDEEINNGISQRPSNLKSIIFLFLIMANFIAFSTGVYLWNKERSVYSETLFAMNTKLKDIESVILCPTRELCLQITKDLNAYSKYKKYYRTLPIYGGTNIQSQIKSLKQKYD